jgi:hypothetical protein
VRDPDSPEKIKQSMGETMRSIRKHTQHVWIDTLSLVCMIVLTITGILLKFKMGRGAHGSTLWGWTRHQWGDFHFWVAVVLVVAITVHLLLHIPWIRGVIYPANNDDKVGKAVLYTAGFGLLIVIGIALLMGAIVPGQG